jgi:hypothetical protein
MDKKKIDKAVLQLLTKVREKKEAIKGAQKKPQWKTNCSLSLIDSRYTSVQDRLNIQTVRDTDRLIEVGAFLLRRHADMDHAATLLGIKYDSLYMGYSIEDWTTDLKTRVAMLKLEEQKKELEILNKRVDKLVTPEQRREMELLELQEILKD